MNYILKSKSMREQLALNGFDFRNAKQLKYVNFINIIDISLLLLKRD